MGHDLELWAATYLEGMAPQERAEFEEHLLACEACWREVTLARAGRALAEGVVDRAPAGLRDTIRASVTAAAIEQHRGVSRFGHPRALAAVAVVVVLLGTLALWRPWQHSGQVMAVSSGSTVAEAVAGFRENRLPGTAVPAQHAPDLSQLGLRLAGAAAGSIEGVDVTVFAYRDRIGSRLDVYRSAQSIPETGEAHEVGGTDDDAWRSSVDGVTVICGPASHTVLLIGSDPGLVDRAGRLLDLV
jgi:anti-sigma factor RsiW